MAVDSAINLPLNIQKDIKTIGQIDAIPSILDVICRATNMRFVAVARVTENNWVACAVKDDIAFGLKPGGELKVETTLCHEVRQSQEGVIIDHVAEDEVYSCHATPAMYGFQSYISIPIFLKDGSFFGTLCAIDPKPARLNNPETIGMFRLFAELIAFHIKNIEQLAIAETKLLEELKTAELREQFIAILGHDLRNPVGAVSTAAEILVSMPLENTVKRLSNIILNSSYRMKGLIENILDFARGKLGGGITLSRHDHALDETLEQVITELRISWLDKIIETSFDLAVPVNCDARRLAQLFSNLLGNSLTHGKKDTAVRVNAESNNESFTFSVFNCGEKIPDAAMKRLFRPFARGEFELSKEGLPGVIYCF